MGRNNKSIKAIDLLRILGEQYFKWAWKIEFTPSQRYWPDMLLLPETTVMPNSTLTMKVQVLRLETFDTKDGSYNFEKQ